MGLKDNIVKYLPSVLHTLGEVRAIVIIDVLNFESLDNDLFMGYVYYLKDFNTEPKEQYDPILSLQVGVSCYRFAFGECTPEYAEFINEFKHELRYVDVY